MAETHPNYKRLLEQLSDGRAASVGDLAYALDITATRIRGFVKRTPYDFIVCSFTFNGLVDEIKLSTKGSHRAKRYHNVGTIAIPHILALLHTEVFNQPQIYKHLYKHHPVSEYRSHVN